MTDEFHRIRRLPPYVFAEVNTAKAQARAAGEDIIDLGMGNPDSPTPPHIVAKLVETVADPRSHRYSVSKGIPGLRRALASYYRRRFDVALDPETEVIATLGSKEGLANLASAITSPGDTILVPNPSYPIHQFGFIIAGAAVRSIPAEPGDEMLAALDRAVRHSVPKPTALIVNFPSNPTAFVADLEFYKALVAFARRHEIWIMSDLAYAEIYFDEDRPPPSLLAVEGAKEVAVEFTSMSKTYSMAGWRMGFAAGNPQLIRALTRIKSYLDYGAFTPIQVASVAALNGPQDCVAEIRGIYRERRDVLIRGLAAAGWDVPNAARARCSPGRRSRRSFAHLGFGGVRQAADGRGQGRGGAGARLRRARRGVRADRAGGEHAPAAPGHAQHPAAFLQGSNAPPPTAEGADMPLEKRGLSTSPPLRVGIAGLGHGRRRRAAAAGRERGRLSSGGPGGRIVAGGGVGARPRARSRDPARGDALARRPGHPRGRILDLDAVVEVIGGAAGPALGACRGGRWNSGRHLVTANKAMIAVHGGAPGAARGRTRRGAELRGRGRGRHSGAQDDPRRAWRRTGSGGWRGS